MMPTIFSLSVFSLVPDLLSDCSRVLEYAKRRTVLESTLFQVQLYLYLFYLFLFFCFFFQALILRDYWLLTVISVLFEVLEYSLEHQLPNFSECWWDHVCNCHDTC